MAVLATHSRGPSVAALQRSLRAAGFNPGAVDGVFGPKTRAAVERFQRAKGLTVDGLVGTDTRAALRRAREEDRFEPATRPAAAARSAPARGANRTAVIQRVEDRGARDQLVTGQITINGRAYAFRSGGYGRGNLPRGEYEVRAHRWSRHDRSMSVGGVGYSFALSDKFDARTGATRRSLRIHPDGGATGTEGCIGIIGDSRVQRRFREDMRAELARSGGSFTLRVG